MADVLRTIREKYLMAIFPKMRRYKCGWNLGGINVGRISDRLAGLRKKRDYSEEWDKQ
jgi:hypothetical protein